MGKTAMAKSESAISIAAVCLGGSTVPVIVIIVMFNSSRILEGIADYIPSLD